MTGKPKRIQIRRTKGWRMPPNTVKVDRTTKWGNPFVQGGPNPFVKGERVEDRQHAVALYKAYAKGNKELAAAARAELRGKNLACWCSVGDGPGGEDICHGATLLKLANR